MRVYKRLAIALAIASTLGAATLSHAATTIKVANFFPDTHPNSIALKETFAKEVESRSHGTYFLTHFIFKSVDLD